jgi:hypothetical protein
LQFEIGGSDDLAAEFCPKDGKLSRQARRLLVAQVLVAQMKHILAALLLLLWPTAAKAWQVGDIVPVQFACRTQQAINAIAEADKASDALALDIFKKLMSIRLCAAWPMPIGHAKIGEITARYIDSAGRETIIARCVSPNAPDENFWMLLTVKRPGKAAWQFPMKNL